MATLETEENGHCREVAVVERFKQESMHGLSAKKVAIMERLLLSRGLNKSQYMDCLPKKWPL